MNSEFFSFQLADSIRIALPLTHVEKIIQIPQQQICPLPGIASYWAGIANYQGSLLWVLDSEQFFNLVPSRLLKKANWTAIVVTFQTPEIRRRIAISVKSLNGILAVDLATSSHSSSLFPLLPQFQPLFSSSIFYEDELLLFLEIEQFFASLSGSDLSLIDV
jgi:twitching motility protein PilI